jgi:type II secretory pathway pseudopilin PulG
MVVVVISGILATYISPRFMDKADDAKIVKAKIDIAALETSLKMYKLDNGVYPTTDQGLATLIEKPTSDSMDTGSLKNVHKSLFLNRCNKGFLLFEIMISVSIMALVFVALFRMQSGSVDLAAKSKFKNITPMLASIQLSKIEDDLADWSIFSGDFGDDFKGFTWTVVISDSSFYGIDVIKEGNYKRFKKIELEILYDQRKVSSLKKRPLLSF